MNPSPHRAHPLGPFAFGRAALPYGAFVYGLLLSQLTWLWVGSGIAMAVECAIWAVQLAKYIDRRPIGLLVAGAALGGLLVSGTRVGASLVRFAHWFALVPIWDVNRARKAAWSKARRAGVVEQVIEEVETMTAWGRAMAALAVLRGARPPEANPLKAESVEGRVIKFGRRPA